MARYKYNKDDDARNLGPRFRYNEDENVFPRSERRNTFRQGVVKRMRQNARFNFRMDSSVKNALEELSKMYDLSAAAYLRILILREKEITDESPNFHKRMLSVMKKEYVGY